MIDVSRIKKTITFVCVLVSIGICMYFANKAILEFLEINSQILRIEKQQSLETITAKVLNPGVPLKAGSLKADKGAYFSIQFEFYGDNFAKNPENLFQTAPLNSGIRVEHYLNDLSIIFSDTSVKNGYKIILLTNNLKKNRIHYLKIEALSKEFIRIKFDNNNFLIKSPDLVFSTQDFVVGGGFNELRNYSGKLQNIILKKVNYHSRIESVLKYYPTSLDKLINFIGQGGIYLAALVLLVIGATKIDIKKIKINIQNTWIFKQTYKSLFVMACIQVILILCFPFYSFIVITYLFLYLLGYPCIFYLLPNFLKFDKYTYIFSPLFGLGILSIVGAYIIAFNIQVKTFLILLLLTILGWMIFYAIIYVKRFRKKFENKKFQLKPIHNVLNVLTFYIFPIVFVLLFPALSIDGLTTPIRVGPDAALYASMSQYLLDGGTWFTANLRAQEFDSMSAGEITRYTNSTMNWPFMYFYRWGLVIYQSVFSKINSLEHAYQAVFTSLILPYLMVSGLVYYWLRERFQLSILIAATGATCIIFNVNLINLWFEGFYGNVFSLCFYAFLYLMIDIFKNQIRLTQLESYKYIFLFVFIFLTILVSYGEGLIFVIPPLLAIHFLYNLIFNKNIYLKLYVYLLLSLIIAVIILLPCGFLDDWIILSLKQVTEEGGNGFPQPFWASINEILGLGNIYAYLDIFNSGLALRRSNLNILITLVISLLVLVILFRYIIRYRGQLSLGVSAYLLTALFGLYIFITNPLNNYGYMKMYIFLLPILFVYFWVALSFFQIDSLNKVWKIKFSYIIVTFLIIINGLTYIISYERDSKKIPVSLIKEHKKFKDLNLDDAVIYPIVKTNLYFVLPAVFAGEWITTSWNGKNFLTDHYFNKFLNRKVFLLYEGKCNLNENRSTEFKTILNGKNFTLIDSNLLVSNLLYRNFFNLEILQNIELDKICENN